MTNTIDNTKSELKKLGEDWAAAEKRGDTDFLQHNLADDFVGIGPRGFMLTKEEWLARHKSGDLKYESLKLDDVKIRVYGEAAIATGREAQMAKYQGHDVPGEFRTTLVFVKQQRRWQLAGLHLSPIVQGP